MSSIYSEKSRHSDLETAVPAPSAAPKTPGPRLRLPALRRPGVPLAQQLSANVEGNVPAAPAKAPRDPGVTANLERFHQGTGRVNMACLGGDADSVALFGTMVVPAVEGLVEEFGGENSVATRMLCTMAASSFAEWSQLSGFVRTAEIAAMTERDVKAFERALRRQEQSYRRTVTCLEMLRRPDSQNLRIAVGTAGNLNLGVQTAIQTGGDGDVGDGDGR